MCDDGRAQGSGPECAADRDAPAAADTILSLQLASALQSRLSMDIGHPPFLAAGPHGRSHTPPPYKTRFRG
jgi:hypothetical protein